MSDYPSLLSGVLNYPHDDLRRLVIADWHEDNGDIVRAQEIRNSIEKPDSYLVLSHQDLSLVPRDVAVRFKRGFIYSIAGSLDAIYRSVDSLLQFCPIERISFSDSKNYWIEIDSDWQVYLFDLNLKYEVGPTEYIDSWVCEERHELAKTIKQVIRHIRNLSE